MAYSGTYVFGDSLVDAGNALGLAEWYSDLTFSDMPEGAPTAEDGYFAGRFADGYTFADLIANKAIGSVTEPVFPYGYEDPWIGIPIAPFAGDPDGNNLNFAYGGAQVRQGDEVVQDLDMQTDTFRNAVDGDAPPGALYIVTMGGNDVRNLATVTGTPQPPVEGGFDALDNVAQQLVHELGQLVDDGARNFLITGCADVGRIPDYDIDNDGLLNADEQMRADTATAYSEYLDLLIRTEVVPALEEAGATVTYVPMMDYEDGGVTVTGGLNAVLPTVEYTHGLAPGTLTSDLLTHRDLVFFDDIHPNAQVHALFGAYAQALLTGTEWVETLPLAEADYAASASIGVAGEVDKTVFVLAAGTEYRFDALGISTLGVAGSLGDPALRLLSPSGTLAGSNDDSGAGFDAVLGFTTAEAGNYTLRVGATGSLTGAYELQASVIGGAAMLSGQTYVVSNAAWVVLEGAGGAGIDVIRASTSYALREGCEIEMLTTTDAKARGNFNLTGNEFGQEIVGNNGVNVLDGKGGADTLTGGGGKDVFVLGGGEADTITDYAKGDVVDVSQVLSVAAGTNVVSGGFVRVTTSGLVQVDASGGGNEWVTLGHINGSGAVGVRYVSGGTLATVQVGRVAETTLLAASVAAAGMAAMTAPETGGTADAGHELAAAAVAAEPDAYDFGHFPLAEAVRFPAPHEQSFERAAAEPVQHITLVERVAFDAVEAAPERGAMPLLEATDLAAAPLPQMTAEMAMPLLDAILADALGSEVIAPLDAVPGAEAVPADIATLAPALQFVGLELIALHADAVASV